MSSTVSAPVGAFSRRDAAKYLGCSERLIDRLSAERQIVPCKIGRKTVFQREELERFLASRRQEEPAAQQTA